MSNKVGRNQPCPCGSGKKYKHCCFGKDTKSEASNRNIIVWGGALLVGVIVFYVVLSKDSSTPGFQSRPSGQAPLGKVWSAEHGHWHDASGNPFDSIPSLGTPPEPVVSTQLTPQPGPAPSGKVWDAEHGHWHDASGAPFDSIPSLQTPPEPVVATGNTPQPPGPAPEGKVWNAEHGHWHNAPASDPSAIPNWDPLVDSVRPTPQPPDSAPS